MPATTPKGYPYPLGTDRVMDGDDSIHALATAVDTNLGVQASGKATIPVVSNTTNYSVSVTYPVGRFTETPHAVATAISSAAAAVFYTVGAGNASGFAIYGQRTSGSGPFDCYWIARSGN